jgi:signal recognition particle GTPase
MPWIGAAAAVGGALIGSSSSKKAAKQQAAAADRATAESARQFDVTRKDMAPWQGVGEEGLYTLADLLGLGSKAKLTNLGRPEAPVKEAFYKKSDKPTGYQSFEANWATNSPAYQKPIYGQVFDQAAYEKALNKYTQDMNTWNAGMQSQTNSGSGSLLKDFTMEDFKVDPGYQFRENEGTQAVQRAAAAAGRRMAPQTMKELLRFNSDLASQEFGNAFNRDTANKQRKYNFLSGVSGTGQTAATQLGQFGAQQAQYAGNNAMSAGNAMAAGTMGQANAWGNALGQVANIWSQNRALDKYLSPQQSFTGVGAVPY